jgi:hypothetical protein
LELDPDWNAGIIVKCLVEFATFKWGKIMLVGI